MVSSTKINHLLQQLLPGAVVLSSWLVRQGYSLSLQQSWRQSGWFTSLGRGAMARTGQKPSLAGAIHALQAQAGLPVHLGGRTALGMQGYSHYIEINQQERLLFMPPDTHLPAWLLNHRWDSRPVAVKTSFLPTGAGLVDFEENGNTLKISGATRAIMECLEMAPARFDLAEAWEIMQGLSLLPPATVRPLLEQCSSVKVKRLFLHFAEKAGHAWFRKIRPEEIDLGRGKRSLVARGVYVPKYKITLPEALA